MLKQKNNAPAEVAHQVCILYAVTKGYLKDIDVARVPEFELQLKEFMDNRYGAVLDAIRTTGKLESDTEELLKTALTELIADFTAGN